MIITGGKHSIAPNLYQVNVLCTLSSFKQRNQMKIIKSSTNYANQHQCAQQSHTFSWGDTSLVYYIHILYLL